MSVKERVDTLLVRNGLFDTREQAKRAIMAGRVYIDETRVDKPGTKIKADSQLTVKGPKEKYVGRGGYKLEKALDHFQIDIFGQTAIDIGASTGGFTDCMLQNGAKKVYAVDVGYNQLAWKLRRDERVVVMERMNFRYADPSLFEEDKPTFAAIDVSFISLTYMLPVLGKIIAKKGKVISLVKPQFEAGRDEVGKKGIVRDRKVHTEVLDKIIAFAEKEKYAVRGLTYSPILGGDGNIEFLLYLSRGIDQAQVKIIPESIVEEAHQALRS